MRIIDHVEIRYFRSIYSLNLSANNHINLFIGENDAGKSNILKALNLFFNNQSELGQEFDFLSDLSRFREDEARRAKGRATIWMKVTFNNVLNWKSLPSKFTIKKQWNRYQTNPIENYPKDVPAVTIGRFLSKVSFHYIPAVRSRQIFAYYLSLLHDSLIEDEKAGVRVSSQALMEAINLSTEEMSEKIQTGLGFESNVKVPEDLRDLFQALDFSTVFSGYDVPLQRRGDGIQARHIPFILDFIARHSNQSHIWAYEEPENSLELSKAFELAEQFNTDFSLENQVFITTHSPAFYDLAGARVRKWLVQSVPEGPGGELATVAEPVAVSDRVDERLGIAALISARSRELYERNRSLMEAVGDLKEQVEAANRAQVIVEGPFDEIILSAARDMLDGGGAQYCDFVPAQGAANVATFVKTSSRLQTAAQVPVIGLVDNDSEGRKQGKQFDNLHKFADTEFRVVNHVKKVYFGALPVPDEFGEVAGTIRGIGGPDFSIPICVEFMFPRAVIVSAINNGILILRDRMAKARDHELGLPINITANFSEHLPDGYEYFASEIDDGCKDAFANWVIEQGEDAFQNFVPLMDQLRQLSDT